MPTVNLAPTFGVGWQALDNSGAVLTGGKLYTYAAGTTTPAATYTTSTGNVAHSNPIVLDSAGRVNASGEIWLIAGVAYKFILKTSNDVEIKTYDNVLGISSGTYSPQNFTGDGTTTIFTLTFAPINENSTFIFINGVYQQKNTYSVSGTSLVFSEAPPTTSKIEVMYN